VLDSAEEEELALDLLKTRLVYTRAALLVLIVFGVLDIITHTAFSSESARSRSGVVAVILLHAIALPALPCIALAMSFNQRALRHLTNFCWLVTLVCPMVMVCEAFLSTWSMETLLLYSSMVYFAGSVIFRLRWWPLLFSVATYTTFFLLVSFLWEADKSGISGIVAMNGYSRMDIIKYTIASSLFNLCLVGGSTLLEKMDRSEFMLRVKIKCEMKKLHERESIIRSFNDTAADAIIIIDSIGHIQSFNAAAQRIFQYSSEDVLGKDVAIIMPEPYKSEHQAYVVNYIRTGVSKIIGTAGRKTLAMRKDGSVFPVELSVSAMIIDTKHFFTGIVRDVSEKQYLEDQLIREKRLSEQLLSNVLPQTVAVRLKMSADRTIADWYEDVTCCFLDIVGFTHVSSQMSADHVVSLLNDIFSLLDALADKYQVEKIKTTGDCYMAVGGLYDDGKEDKSVSHTCQIAEFALDSLASLSTYNQEHQRCIQLRVGISCGSAVAGVIGKRRLLFDMWGDSINVGSRMESQSLPNKIQVTEAVFERLKGSFAFENRGEVNVKGKGNMSTYFLLGRKAAPSPLPSAPCLLGDCGGLGTLPDDIAMEVDAVNFHIWHYPSSMYGAMIKHMLASLGLISAFSISDCGLNALVSALINSYRSVPFHNLAHSLDVCQAMYLFLRGTDSLSTFFDQVDVFALVIAALCHDIEHPGQTNAFQVAARTRLAVLYNEMSVLENHHASRANTILEQNPGSILQGLNADQRRRFRQMMTKSILATDISKHNDYLADFTMKFLIPTTTPDDPFLLGGMLLKCADLINAARDFENAKRWADQLQEEFFVQGDLEKELALPVSRGMDRMLPSPMAVKIQAQGQGFFSEKLVQPLYMAVFKLLPNFRPFCDNITSNIAKWKPLGA